MFILRAKYTIELATTALVAIFLQPLTDLILRLVLQAAHHPLAPSSNLAAEYLAPVWPVTANSLSYALLVLLFVRWTSQKKTESAVTTFSGLTSLQFAIDPATILMRAFLIIQICSVSPCVTYNLSVATACELSNLRAYEAAERIYLVLPVRSYMGHATSLVAMLNNEDDKTRQEVDKTIAHVYGRNSLEMAYRYALLGDKCRCIGVSHAKLEVTAFSLICFMKAIGFYSEALQIHTDKHDIVLSIDDLSNIAYCKSRLGKMIAARGALNRGLELLNKYGTHDLSKLAMDRFALTAHRLNDTNLEETLWNRAAQMRDD